MEQLVATCVLVENIFPFLDRATYDACRFLNKDTFQLSEQVANPAWPSYGSLHLHHEIASLAVGDNLLAVGCETGEVIIVVRKTMKRFLLLVPPGHTTMAIISIQFSPNETLLATGSVDGSIRLWHLRDNHEGGQAFWETPPRPCSSILPSTLERRASSRGTKPSGSSFLTQGDCPSILIENHHYKPVHSLVFDPTSQYLISAADEPTMIVWNTQTGACEHQLRDRWEYPRSLSLSRTSTINDEHCLAMYGSSGSLRLFSFSSSSFNNQSGGGGSAGGRILDGGFPQLSEIQFSKDGQFLYGRSGQQIYQWNIATGQRSCLPPLVKEQQTIVAVRLSKECDSVARVTGDGRLVISKVTHSNHHQVPASTPMNTPSAYPGQYLLNFTPDGRAIVTANCRPGILEFWGVSL